MAWQRYLLGASVICGLLLGANRALAATGSTSPVTHGIFFAALTDGHVYRSNDHGSTWQEADAGLPRGPLDSTNTLSFTGGSLYAGTAGGVYVSANLGTTWRPASGMHNELTHEFIISLSSDPRHAQTIYAATADNSVYRSTNGGASWTGHYLPGTVGFTATSLVIDPQHAGTLLDALQDGDLPPTDVLISVDGGITWKPTTGLPIDEQFLVFDLAHDWQNAKVAYASTVGGIYKSHDSGRSWSQLVNFTPTNSSDFPRTVAVDPVHSANVLIGTYGGGFYRSTDSGATWTAGTSSNNQEITSVAIDPALPTSILATTRQRTDRTGSQPSPAYASQDGGTTWSQVKTPFKAHVLSLVAGATSGTIAPAPQATSTMVASPTPTSTTSGSGGSGLLGGAPTVTATP